MLEFLSHYFFSLEYVSVCSVCQYVACVGMWHVSVSGMWQYVACGSLWLGPVCGVPRAAACVSMWRVSLCGVRHYEECVSMWCVGMRRVSACGLYITWVKIIALTLLLKPNSPTPSNTR